MKKLLILLLATPFFTQAQNVGIGTTTPAEKLDVTGNVNITGTLKANGNAGSDGQVLMSTGSGLSWGSQAGYKKCVVFMAPGNGTWVVPAGVTEVMAEVWGAGSGGTAAIGGTSGGYARTVQTVPPGYGIAWQVGAGSAYGATTTSSGGLSQVTFPLGYIQANGGGGVNASSVGFPASGSGSLTNNVFYMYGNSGEFTTATYGQRTATIYVQVDHFGSGGATVGMFNPYAVHGDLQVIENGVTTTYSSTHSVVPGAGGAAGYGGGWNGAPGMVIFWFN